MRNLFKIIGLTTVLVTFFSCTKDVGKIPPVIKVDTCTTNIKHTQIAPIITRVCAFSGCHDAATGSPNFTTYTALKTYLDGGKSAYFMARIVVGSSGQMPANYTTGPKTLESCEIDKLNAWVKDGYPQN